MLKNKPGVYSCNAYLVRGTWNRISDLNTLIDVGTDGSIIQEIEEINTGVGKTRVEQVILTHEHFDHAGGLENIKKTYNPKVYAYTNIDGVTNRLKDQQHIKIGDMDSLILHTPGHSNDSVCIYCESEGVLFSGDTTLKITHKTGTYCAAFLKAFEKLTKLKINSIYAVHDLPMHKEVNNMLKESLKNILKSKIID